MPIGDFEMEVLRLLAANRNPESFVAGATVLQQRLDSPRYSRDIDYFHDSAEALRTSAEADSTTLLTHGYEVVWKTQQDAFRRAQVSRYGAKTKVEWVQDSVFRFFPTEPDLDLGWRLNFWDSATNKAVAFVSRSEVRDYLDVLYLHEQHLHLGALLWAAAAKDAGFTPIFMLEEARRTSHYPASALRDVRLSAPVDLAALKPGWLRTLDEANVLIRSLPPEDAGCLYLNAAGQPVTPDPAAADFAGLTRHYGSIRGAVPRIVAE